MRNSGMAALDELRADGWMVAVHNDYRQEGAFRTFWLFTHSNGRWIKGEGPSDFAALWDCQTMAAAIARDLAASDQSRVERLETALLADLEALLNDIDDQGYMLKREWTPELRERVWAFADRFEALRGDRS